jgi:phage-related protein
MKRNIRAKIYRLENGNYSVHLFYPIDDPFLSDILGRDYGIYDIKVFRSRRQAERFASYWEL